MRTLNNWISPKALGLLLVGLSFRTWAASAAETPASGFVAPQRLEDVQALHTATVEAWEKADWLTVKKSAQALLKDFGHTAFAKEAVFHLGAAHCQLQEELPALQALDQYLLQPAPRHFEEALELKLVIAERFAQGRWKPLFELPSMPRIVSAEEDALRILDEVIAAIPSHPLAARALISKGKLLKGQRETRGATDSFQQVIRKFPRDVLAQEAFVQIAEMYGELSRTHFHDANLLDMAEINLAKFERSFPGSLRLDEARSHLKGMRERYASGYLETAAFYRRVNKLGASAFYYACVLRQYPETGAVPEALKELQALSKKTNLPSDILSALEEAEQTQS
jgi:outer membrane protein assembly factor BamD (BamD/ComL family)